MILEEIFIYPIKSCRGISVPTSNVLAKGLEFDRRWMLVDENNRFLTQRQFPNMTQISVRMNGRGLSVSAPGQPSLEVRSKEYRDPHVQTMVWNDACEAVDEGDEASQWFSEFFGFSARLLFMPEGAVPRRSAESGDEKQCSFADSAPLLSITAEALEDLNSRLPSTSMEPLRFRPNLVISGAKAYDDDQWAEILIGQTRFQVIKPKERCVVTTLNPITGEKGQEPLQTLAKYRKVPSGVIFGQNLRSHGEGRVSVGDAIEVISRK